MATGKQMLVAVKYELQQHPELKELTLNRFDAEDLCRAEALDVQDFGATPEEAAEIANNLKSGCLKKLGEWLEIKFEVVARHPNLIPGEGFRRTASMLWTGKDTVESVVQEIRELRSPTTR